MNIENKVVSDKNLSGCLTCHQNKTCAAEGEPTLCRDYIDTSKSESYNFGAGI